MTLPCEINSYLHSVYESKGNPFCFLIDAEYRLQQIWCEKNLPALKMPGIGDSVLDSTPFLLGALTQQVEVLPFVSTRNGHVYEVHTIPHNDQYYVVLLDVRQEHKFRQDRQQTANEVLLLHAIQEKLIVRQRELIAELIEAKSELDHRRREAERINASKNEFIATMSHEFRTPLAAIINYADRVLEDGVTPADAQKSSDAIGRVSRHLMSLIDTVLDEAKLDANRDQMTEAPFEVINLVDDMAAMLAPLAAEKSLAFAAYLEDNVPPVLLSDVVFLRQILINLLGNAIKYTDTGGVSLYVSWSQDTLNVKIEDTGAGIALEDQERIFQAFKRGVDADTSKPGVGLGLAISLDLARILQGSINIESAVGSGSTISLSLPAPAINNTTYSNDILPRPAADFYATRPASILVCDDDEDMRALCEHYLQRAGYSMMLAENGLKAVAKALTYNPDIILMDINTPKMNGIDATKQLRDSGFTSPILAISASDITQLDGDHFTDSLRKPFQMPELMALIKHHLEE